MSTSSKHTFDSDRMQSKTLQTLVGLTEKYESKANNTPTVAYDDSFWTDLQNTLQSYTHKRYQLASAGSYTTLAAYLRDLEQFGIPLIIGRARNRIETGDPLQIETTTFWNTIYDEIESFETNTITE